MPRNIRTLSAKIEKYLDQCRRQSDAQRKTEEQEALSCRSIRSSFSDQQRRRIDDYLSDLKRPQTQPDYVCEKMPSRGFVYEDGQLNFVKFYTYARINPDVWHTFITRKHKASEDTMFKIIFALRLNEDEAEEFLALGGVAFNQSNDTHKYILACINTQIYDPDEVYEVLEFYKVRNIYAEKKPRSDCQ